MTKIERIVNFFNQRQLLLYLLLFIMAVTLFTYLHLDSTFADPDSFYHAKMAEVLNKQGAITEFPWLSATILKYNFVDHHFLYHIILIPFTIFFSPLIGLKIFTILFAALTIVTIFWFLNRLKIKGAFLYVLLLLTVNPFIFRLNLAKASALAIALLFVIIYLLFNRRYLSLILVSCLYVWLYGGWPIIVMLAVLYGVVNWFWLLWQRGSLLSKIGKPKINRRSLLILISVLLGVGAGLFFSPYFPINLKFYWQQSFKIAVVNYQYIIDVGGEWYPYQLLDLFLAAAPFFLLLIIALAIFVNTFQKQSMNSWFFLALTFIFFALTLKSRRYVEYFIPVGVIFSAISLSPFWDQFKNKLIKLSSRRFTLLMPLIIILIFSPVFIRDLKLIKDSYRQGFAFDKFYQASSWLKENSEAGDIVFHSDWDEFPILFFHNDHNYYLVGLDPTFMYEYDKNLYQDWVNITRGEQAENIYPIIKDVFGAKYVFVDYNQNADFDKNLINNFYFKEVYSDQEAKIYQVTD